MTNRALQVFAVLAVVAVPCAARAQGGSANEAKLKAGIALVKAHDDDKAVTQLSKVYASTKDARALYWIGRAHQDAGRNAEALRVYKQYLREAPATATEPRSVDVLGNIQTLTMQVGTVNVRSTEGATISVDDVEIGKAPLMSPVYLDPGKHTITATREGRPAASKTIDVVEESRTNVVLRVDDAAPEPAAAPAPASSPVRVTMPAPPRSISTTTWVGLGVATALAAGSVFFTVKAAGTAHDFDSRRGELGVTRAELDQLQSQARLQAGLAVGLGVTALAAAGVTLFVLKKPNTERRVIVSGQGVALAGSF